LFYSPVASTSAPATSAEQPVEKTLGLPQSLFRKDYGLGLSDRVADVAFCVQPTHDFPIESLPGPVTFMPAKQQESQHGLVNSVLINVRPHAMHTPVNAAGALQPCEYGTMGVLP
jgi:hypothetical protein